MTAKRALNFAMTPSKRQKTGTNAPLYRVIKPEMKYFDTPIDDHITQLTSARRINNIATGTGHNQRIGSKIKIWHIEGVVVSSNSQPVRIEIFLPNDATVVGNVPYAADLDRKSNAHLKTQFLHNGSHQNLQGYWLQHKLPYGVVSRYSDTSSSSLCAGSIVVSLAVPVATTITGYFRVWYTDV